MRISTLHFVAITVTTVLSLGTSVHADWPAWRGNANRSASTDEQLPAKILAAVVAATSGTQTSLAGRV